MTNYSNAQRRMERIVTRLNQLRDDADREAYNFRNDDGVNDIFNELSDTINDAVTSCRRYTRAIQSASKDGGASSSSLGSSSLLSSRSLMRSRLALEGKKTKKPVKKAKKVTRK